MPRTCTACRHPDRAEIDAGLVRGEPYRHIAALCGVSPDAVKRHKAHIPPQLAKAQAAADVAAADSLLDQARSLEAKALGILDQAEAAGDLRTALAAIREARGTLELLAKLVGELDERPSVNVLVANPEWLALRTRLLVALSPYPEARLAVLAAIAPAAPTGGVGAR